MTIDYDLWRKKHNTCVEKILRVCDYEKSEDAIKKAVKCNSSLCVMKNAMQDVQSYFERDVKSSAELCFLLRNIDFIVTGILDINKIQFGIGLNRTEKAIERCFTNKEIICKFRTLRSMVLAHPVDTSFTNDKGESETIYLEDVLPFNSMTYGLILKKECDYVKRMCKPESHQSFFEPLTVEEDIVPVILTIIDSLDLLISNVDKKMASIEHDFTQQDLVVINDSIQEYIISLDKELEKRYPSAVGNTKLADGSMSHYSIIYDCLMYFDANFKKDTQDKYNVFLNYLKNELKKIEVDLQNMEFNEDKYFLLMYCSEFAPSLSYEKQKMEYLRESNTTSFTDKPIGNDTPSNALWGIRCFRLLIPYINHYIPVDTSVSDKDLYCQYVAATYFCAISDN